MLPHASAASVIGAAAPADRARAAQTLDRVAAEGGDHDGRVLAHRDVGAIDEGNASGSHGDLANLGHGSTLM